MMRAALTARALAIALAMPALGSIAGPSSAAVETIMRACNGQLCPVYRTSFAAPEGWYEARASERLGLRIFVPVGQTFEAAEAVIYATVRFNPDKSPLVTVVAEQHRTWRRTVRDVTIKRLDDVARTDGEPFRQHAFIAPRLAAQPFGRIATTNDGDADGNMFVIRLVLAARSEQALESAEGAYRAMLEAY